MEEKCSHKSFELGIGNWICQWCKEIFSAEEVEKIMIQRRSGFEEPEPNQKYSPKSPQIKAFRQ